MTERYKTAVRLTIASQERYNQARAELTAAESEERAAFDEMCVHDKSLRLQRKPVSGETERGAV